MYRQVVDIIQHKHYESNDFTSVDFPDWKSVKIYLDKIKNTEGYFEIVINNYNKVLSVLRTEDAFSVSIDHHSTFYNFYQIDDSGHEIINSKILYDFKELKKIVYDFYKLGKVPNMPEWESDFY